MDFVSMATSHDERARNSSVAVLPVGSFEQHGGHLPLATDTLIACIVAKAIAELHDVFVLPPITISCSHEHANFPGTVSITSSTLTRMIDDIRDSLRSQGIEKLVLVSGHGGNYVLSNVAQQANADARTILLYPSVADWDRARIAAGLQTTAHDDMHGGEGETSILLHYASSTVRDGWSSADHEAASRPDFLTLGMRGYTESGIIGRPSLATADKGKRLVEELAAGVAPHLSILGC
ncbi:creatininase family protein [Microlunatus ginsengisoli]|uniref:Creatininase family protein n=1 Tax=Microlunatus ginsengisoli TaxID=363863 RepID=A0ABP7AEW9_9ACTN